MISHGCATVRAYPPNKKDHNFKSRNDAEMGIPVPNPEEVILNWTDLYQYLIKRRKEGESKNVGTLTVVD